jgi:TonB family protein
VAFLPLGAYSQSGNDAPENDIGLVSSERGFRLEAQRKVMPAFPDEALKAGAQGVVVLSLYQDAEGLAAKIKVLESPHPAISEAAIKAVEQWKWRRFVKGGIGRPVQGKLTFYFIIENGSGRVEDPRIIIEEEKKRKAARGRPS